MNQNPNKLGVRAGNMRSRRLAALAATATLAGCTVQMHAVRVVDPNAIPREGAPYNLTFTQYDVEVTRSVLACTNKKDGEETPQLSILLEAKTTRKEVRDPKRDYVIDFAQLRSFFKTSDVTVEYHANGALKSVNATVTDQTGPFFTSLVTNLGKVVTVAGGGLLTLSENAPKPVCNEATLKALAKVKQLDADLKAASQEGEALTADIERLTKMAQVMGRVWSVQERMELKDRINRSYAVQKKLKDATEGLAQAKKLLVIKADPIAWPTDGETRETAVRIADALTTEQLGKWVEKGALAPSGSNVKGNDPVWVNLVAATAIGKTKPCTGTTCADDVQVGLKYRMPVPGALLICSTANCAAIADADVGLAQETAISQLGPVMTLPLRNYPFMNQTITATFNEAGQPTKLGFTQTPSPDKALDTLGTLASEVSRYRAAKQPKSELDTIKDETTLLKAKAELAAAQAALQPKKDEYAAQADSVALLTADTSVLKAQLTKVQLEAALAKALAESEKP